jgi:hypothetical protein
MLLTTRTTGGVVRIDVVTGGKDYESPPQVVLSNGGGTGAQAVAHMAGTRVESIVITNKGTGYTGNPTVAITAATGGGAEALAYAYTGPLRPVSFFRGRYNDMYGVDGMGRGFRWVDRKPSSEGNKVLSTEAGASLLNESGSLLVTAFGAIADNRIYPIGVEKPAVAPTVAATSAGTGNILADIQIVAPGVGYASPPSVVLTGGTPSSPAAGRALLSNGQVTRIIVTDVGSGYQGTPTVSLQGGVGGGAELGVGLLGEAATVRIIDPSVNNVTEPPLTYPVILSNANGLTGFAAIGLIDGEKRMAAIRILAAGTGATTTGQVVTLDGHSATIELDLVFSIATVTVASSGSGLYTPPVLTVERQRGDQPFGDSRFADAIIRAEVDGEGHVSGATVVNGGQYRSTPRVYVADSNARAQATMRAPLIGKYFCAVRYIDHTPDIENGPIPSSLSDIAEIDMGDGGYAIEWNLSHYDVDERVTGIELYRTTAGQRTVFFRVATLTREEWDEPYIDTLGDDQITSPTREGYGLLPVTLPSGQVNARRFAVPPGEFAVACMFQDRAWYAVDTLGLRPNTLMFSEVDEPESVSAENELVLQENSPIADRIVALLPLASAMLVAQRNHLYRLMYVSQPIIDASMTLVAYRGVLNDRCWAVMAGIAFLVDDHGMYAFDGTTDEPISAPIETFWRDRVIDFSKSEQFHVSADLATRVVRFHYCKSEDSAPVRALCFSAFTKSWWEEHYPSAVTATSPAVIGQKLLRVSATANGEFLKSDGLSDAGTAIPYQYRSPPYALADQSEGSISILYKPTPSNNDLQVSMHFNNASTPRVNAVRTDVGAGFVSERGGTFASLNMSVRRSLLGDATGIARAGFYKVRNDRSVGADRHVAVAIAGTQAGSTVGDDVVIHAIQIEGAG